MLKGKQNSKMHFGRAITKCGSVFSASIRRGLCTAAPSAGEAFKWQRPSGHDTGIQIQNCVARCKVPLVVRNENTVTWYTCGPTVYDATHLGHAACYMKVDIIQRILRQHFRLNLVTAMNITDIDDKIIRRSKETNEDWRDLSSRYEGLFWEDMRRLGILRADIVLRVKSSIDVIVDFVRKLVESGDAYVASDGSVYYRNRATAGKLRNLGEVPKQTQSDGSVRESAADYALWKAAKPGEPSWEVPWSCASGAPTAGRPGWHSECSAMASEIFGDRIDIHAGGIDLRFPHHENEESQCCSYHRTEQWVNYWIHIGHLVTTDNVKMSKSLKNTVSIAELLQHYSADQFRMACLITGYSEHIQFGDEIMAEAVKLSNRFSSFLDDTANFVNHRELQQCFGNHEALRRQINESTIQIDRALKSNFDLPACVYVLTELMSALSRQTAPSPQTDASPSTAADRANGVEIVQSAHNIVKRFLQTCGFDDTVRRANKCENSNRPDGGINTKELIDEIIAMRSELRADAKLSKDERLFQICNKLRDVLKHNGIEVKDLKSASSWRTIPPNKS